MGYIFCEQKLLAGLISVDSKFPLTLHLSLSVLGQLFISFEILQGRSESLWRLMLWSTQPSWERLIIVMHLNLATCWMFCHSENIWCKPLADVGQGRQNMLSANRMVVAATRCPARTRSHPQTGWRKPPRATEKPLCFFSSSLHLVHGTTEMAGICNSVQGIYAVPLPQQRRGGSKETGALLLVSDSWAKGQVVS